MTDIKPPHMAGGFVFQTSHKDEVIFQELYSKQNDQMERISQWVCNTREQGTRDALIEMGWTPPNEKK